jgi:hypothetical protein
MNAIRSFTAPVSSQGLGPSFPMQTVTRVPGSIRHPCARIGQPAASACPQTRGVHAMTPVGGRGEASIPAVLIVQAVRSGRRPQLRVCAGRASSLYSHCSHCSHCFVPHPAPSVMAASAGHRHAGARRSSPHGAGNCRPRAAPPPLYFYCSHCSWCVRARPSAWPSRNDSHSSVPVLRGTGPQPGPTSALALDEEHGTLS